MVQCCCCGGRLDFVTQQPIQIGSHADGVKCTEWIESKGELHSSLGHTTASLPPVLADRGIADTAWCCGLQHHLRFWCMINGRCTPAAPPDLTHWPGCSTVEHRLCIVEGSEFSSNAVVACAVLFVQLCWQLPAGTAACATGTPGHRNTQQRSCVCSSQAKPTA
jgi:hypothetical protein